VTNNNLTYHTLFGMLLVVLVTVSASSLPLVTMVFAQTTAEGGNAAAAADTLTSGANETTATATTTDGDNNMTEAKFLFIQSAQSGSVSEVNDTTSNLELNDVSDKTILFSDRPDRIVVSANTTDFIGNWSLGPDNFAVDPPNAVLIVDDEIQQRQDYAIIELFNPQYDPEANTLRYDIIAENATTTTSIDLPSEFGQSTLVIDDETEQCRQLQSGYTVC
jgi:hypothetical protein